MVASRMSVNAGEDDAFDRNARLLRERIDQDVYAGRAFVRKRVDNLFPGVLGAVVSPLVRAFYAAVGESAVERRIHRYLDVVLEASRDAQARGLEVATDAWAPKALTHEEFIHRGNADDPAYPEIRRILKRAFTERLGFICAFLTRGRGDTYEEAVRTAFPDRRVLDEAFGHQVELSRRAVDLVESSPGVLRFPRRLLRPLLVLTRDAIDWYEGQLRHQLDAIYRAAS